MRRRATAGAAALLVAMAAPRTASAEWQLKPYVGFTFAPRTTIEDLDEAVGGPNRTYGVSAMVLGEVFGAEADLGRVPGLFEGKPSLNRKPLVASSSVLTVSGDVIIAVPRRRAGYGLRPYAVAGAGLMRVHFADPFEVVTVSDSMTAMNIGGGVTGFFNRWIGVSWEVRRFQSVGGYSLPVELLNPLGPPEERLSFWRATIAMAIR